MLIGSCALTVTLRRVPLNEANRAPKARGVLAMVHSFSMVCENCVCLSHAV
jgi:hypothetical protein